MIAMQRLGNTAPPLPGRGSQRGSFLLEAAQMALDIAPGLGRSFGFEKFAGFDAAHWDRLRAEARARRREAAPAAVHPPPD